MSPGIPLRWHQAADLTENRLRQLVQAGERQPGFRLHPLARNTRIPDPTRDQPAGPVPACRT